MNNVVSTTITTTTNNIPMNIYIPHIFPNNANLEKVQAVFHRNKLAELADVTFLKRQNYNTNEDFYVAFVSVKRWYDNPDAISFQAKIRDPMAKAEVYYNRNKFWLCKDNKYERPATLEAANATKENEAANTTALQTEYFPTLKESVAAMKLGKSLEEEKNYLTALVKGGESSIDEKEKEIVPLLVGNVINWIDNTVKQEEEQEEEEEATISPAYYESRLGTEYVLDDENIYEHSNIDDDNNIETEEDFHFNEMEATCAFRDLVQQQQIEEWRGDTMAGHYALVDASYAEILERNFANERAATEERQKISDALHANDLMRLENAHHQERLAWQQERQVMAHQIMYLQRRMKEQENLLCNGILVLK